MNKDDLADMLNRRERKLESMIANMGLPIRMIGDRNNPAFVYNNAYVLSLYVHNFELRFMSKPSGGEMVAEHKIRSDSNLTREEFLEVMGRCEHRAVFIVRLGYNFSPCPQLYLAGYNFTNKQKKEGRYPVFSAKDPKVYFTREHADDVSKQLAAEGYRVMVSTFAAIREKEAAQ